MPTPEFSRWQDKQLSKGKSESKKKSTPTSRSDSEHDDHMSTNDDSDMDVTNASDSHNEDEEMQNPAHSTTYTNKSFNVGDFVLVQCPSQKRKASLSFVAKIEEKIT